MKDKLTIELLLEEKFDQKLLSGLKFEEGISLLDELTEQVEGGALPLDAALLAYERGSELASHLRKLVQGAEAKLRLIKQMSDGELQSTEIELDESDSQDSGERSVRGSRVSGRSKR